MNSSTFKIGINRKIVGKCDPDKLSYAGAWENTSVTVAELAAHIERGNPWMPALLNGQRRYQRHANHAETSALDIDGGMSIQAAIARPFISQHCSLGIESASSTEQHNKFRLVFRLPRPVTDWKTIRICNRYLGRIVGAADPACKDASRYFFGAPGRKPFLLNESACLPDSFIDDAIAWHEEEERQYQEEERKRRKQWEDYRRENPLDNQLELVAQAWDCIPPYVPGNNTYPYYVAAAAGTLREYGTAGRQIIEGWSGGANFKGGLSRWLDTVERSRPGGRTASIGSLFYFAKEHRFEFPKREYKPSEPSYAREFDAKDRQQWEAERAYFKEQSKQSLIEKIKAICKQAIAPTAQSRPGKRAKPPKRDNTPDAAYTPGSRIATWQRAKDKGYRYILDTSGTGEGKSFDTGNAEPKDFGATQLIYATDQQRNPTTDTLSKDNGWASLEARHGGLVRESTANGGSRLRRAKKGESYSVAPNCNRTGLINALRAKNVNGADTAAMVCGGCPLKEACTHAEGRGYGFLNQRKNAIPSPKLRAHPDSLPEPIDYEFGSAAIIWDEAGQNINFQQQVRISLTEIQTTIGKLAIADSAQFNLLKPLLEALVNLVQGKHGRYGLNYADVLAQLPTVPDEVDVLAIERSLQPSFDFLNTTAKYGEDLASLPSEIRKRFAESDAESAKQAAENIDKQWLPEFLRVLRFEQRGAVHVGYGLTIWYADNRHRAIAQSAAVNVFLDATLSREQLALMLGCGPSEIFVCAQQSEPTTNLDVIQVYDLGRMGMQRGNHQQKRAEAIVNHYKGIDEKTSAIDFKKYDSDGAWWRDSRGVNDFLETNTLILVGTPCPNLADLMARFAILTGGYPSEDNEDFQRFVDEFIEAEFIQAVGRLRANRRRDEQLTLVIVSDFELSIPTRQIAAKDITIEAASKSEHNWKLVQDAVAHLKATGEKVTQSAVSAITGFTQGYISKLTKLFQTLLDPPTSNWNNPEVDKIAPVVESAIAASDNLNRVAEVANEAFSEWLPCTEYASALFDKLSHNTKSRIFAALISAIDPNAFPREEINNEDLVWREDVLQSTSNDPPGSDIVGQLAKYGTSLSSWLITGVNGAIATIELSNIYGTQRRQVPLNELELVV